MHTCAKVAIRKLSACPNVVLYFCGFSVARVNYCHCFSFFVIFFFLLWCCIADCRRMRKFLDWAAFVACYQLSAACRCFLLFKLRNVLSTICPLIYWLLWRWLQATCHCNTATLGTIAAANRSCQLSAG